jgi:hypothetical protein
MDDTEKRIVQTVERNCFGLIYDPIPVFSWCNLEEPETKIWTIRIRSLPHMHLDLLPNFSLLISDHSDLFSMRNKPHTE